jgi:hypothetical protein
MTEHKVSIFSMPQEFPCGADSTCCGAIGQTDEQLHMLKNGLETALGISVDTFNVKNGADMKAHRKILELIRSFGWSIIPIITVDEEVVSMGAPTVQQAIDLVKSKRNNNIKVQG